MPKSYKELHEELDEIMGQLELSALDIDESIELYKKGEKLIGLLEKRLKEAKNEIKKLA
jgi:exodeoxyribonuclease VII small subunit